MATKSDEFKSGDHVPTSGIYEAVHDRLDGDDHAPSHEVIAIAGTGFPPCRACQGWVRFRLQRAAPHIDVHPHFKP